MYGRVGGVFKTLPRGKQRVAKAGIEQAGTFACGGNFHQQDFQSRKFRLRQATAVFAGWVGFPQDSRARVCSQPPNGLWFGDANPHFKIDGLLYQHVFLGGKQPKQIAAANLIFAIRKEIEAVSLRHEVELQFGMMMHGIGATVVTVVPDIPVESSGQFKFLAHDDKK